MKTKPKKSLRPKPKAKPRAKRVKRPITGVVWMTHSDIRKIEAEAKVQEVAKRAAPRGLTPEQRRLLNETVMGTPWTIFDRPPSLWARIKTWWAAA